MNMKFGKKSGSVVAIYAIILAIYVLAFLIIPFNKTAASWISFAFTIVAFAASLVIFNIAFNAKGTVLSKLYGYPIFKVGATYAILQLALGLIVCIIAAFVDVPYWVALLISVFLLGVTVIGVIITDNTRDVVEKVEEETKAAIKTVTYFKISVSGIVDSCEDAALKSELKKLDDEFRYSDPVSSQYTKDSEDRISYLLSELREFVESNNVDEATVRIKKISNTLAERNRICKATKGN